MVGGPEADGRADGARVVAVLARAPSAPGKRRLFDALGLASDPALLAALLLDTLDGVSVPGVPRLVAVDPPAAVDDVRALVPPGVAVIAQGDGDLGARMRALMGAAFAGGARAVVLVGSDLPDIQPAVVEAAFAALAADPGALVLGPALDGGYYLVASTHVPDVFDGVAWGTPSVLDETRARARAAGLTVRLLPPLRDVDVPDDLRRVRAPRTSAWVRRGTC